MTVVQRRSVPRRRASTSQRFPRMTRVQVYEDVQDSRFAGRIGTVVDVVDEGDDIYPRGRVAVRLVVDELYASLFGRKGSGPQPVWFKPNDLEKLDG